MTDDTAAALSAEDKARAEAQARREKILSKAENRLDMVAGVSARNEINDDGTNDANNNSSDAKKDAKAAKLAAMRRRRFKKGGGSATKKEGETTTTTTTTSTETVSKAEAATKEAATKEETTAKVETTKEEVKETKPPETKEKSETVSPVQTEAKSDETKETTPTPSPTADAAETSIPSDPTATDAAPKKKYMGVAKMRRKMNKERQEREQQEQQSKEAEGAMSATSSKKLRPKSKVKVLPILMHLAVTLLLFWAGLDIGLQQARIDYSSSSSDMESVVKVHATLAAPEQGQRLLNKVASWGGVQSSRSTTTKETLDQLVQDSAAYEVQDEEFREADNGTPKGDNIDPLFQVDLDLYTQGPGLFMMAGRFAVAVHRVNLQIFYYLPLRLVGRVVSVGQSLLNAPPMLCLVALAIRQAIGKLLLGAQLPDPAADSSSGGAQGKDLVSMVKNVAKNFFARAFPTLATLYDMWTHLRADMYVIFCGLFVGMAWHHFSSSPSLKAMLMFGGGDGSSSMTVPPAEPPTMATLESASSPVPVLPTDMDDVGGMDERVVQMDGVLAEEEDEEAPEEEEEEEAAGSRDEDVNEDGVAGGDDEEDESLVSDDELEANSNEDDDTNDDEEQDDDEEDNTKETPPLSDEL